MFVSVSGYPPLQPASFQPQEALRRGTVASTPRGQSAVLQQWRGATGSVEWGEGGELTDRENYALSDRVTIETI